MNIPVNRIVFSVAALCSFSVHYMADAQPVRADNASSGASSRALLLSMLEDDWGITKADRESAKAKFDRVKQSVPANTNVDYLYALVLMKQLQYTSAASQLDAAIRLSADNIQAQRAKIWVTTLRKQYGVALAEMAIFVKRFPKPSSTDPTDTPGAKDKQWISAAEDMGRLIGFMEGPVRNRVDQDTCADTRKAIEAGLPPSMKKAFDTARMAVHTEYDNILSGADKMQEQDIVTEDNRRRAAADQIERDRSDYKRQYEEIGPRRDSLRQELQSDLDGIDAEARPLQSQYARLEVDEANLSNQVAIIESDVVRLLAAAAREKDPVRKASLLRRADLLRHSEQPYLNRLSRVHASMRSINFSLTRLASRRTSSQKRYSSEMRALEKSAKNIESRLKRLGYEEKKLADPNKGLTTRITANRKAETLSTYLQFPLESEKLRLQQLLRK